MSLHIRISDTDLHFAAYDPVRPGEFHFETFHMSPQASLTANLREAAENIALLKTRQGRTEVDIVCPVTPVPLAEFQEEDAEETYGFCFAGEGKRRVFYDTVPACNVVVLFALAEETCHTVEEVFGQVRYTPVLGAVVQHFAARSAASTPGKRLFVYTHDGAIDVAIFEGSRLIVFNSYAVRALTDVAYYTFNLANHIGTDIGEAPLFVAGEASLRDPVVEELGKYAAHVFPVNPAADFNRSVVAATAGVPYDLMCVLLK